MQNVGFDWADGSAGELNDLLRWADGRLLLLVFGDLPGRAQAAPARAADLQRAGALRAGAAARSSGRGRPARESVRDPHGHLQGACHVFGHAWALVRPDSYVAATGEAIDARAGAAVASALGLQQAAAVEAPDDENRPALRRTPTRSTSSCSTPTQGLSPAESELLNARLILLLANQVGDARVLGECVAAARAMPVAPSA